MFLNAHPARPRYAECMISERTTNLRRQPFAPLRGHAHRRRVGLLPRVPVDRERGVERGHRRHERRRDVRRRVGRRCRRRHRRRHPGRHPGRRRARPAAQVDRGPLRRRGRVGLRRGPLGALRAGQRRGALVAPVRARERGVVVVGERAGPARVGVLRRRPSAEASRGAAAAAT